MTTPARSVVSRVRRAWAAGDPVVLATDTVYGLVAPAADEQAVGRVFAVKERPIDRRMAVLVADVEQAERWVELTDSLRRLTDRYWPGGLTVVGDRRPAAPAWIGDETTVGVRCPDDDLLRSLAATFGPLAATSANRHGTPTPTTAEGVAASLPEVSVVIDGGARGGRPSTVVAETETGVTVLREGAISAADIAAVLDAPS